MNLKIFLKSIKFAFRARKRVLAFIMIYAILYIQVGKGLVLPGQTQLLWLLVAFAVATVYAILISQFRRRDIAILKCVSWSNSDVMLLLIGEVVLVSLSAFLLVFQLSVEILGVVAYFDLEGSVILLPLQNLIVLEPGSMFLSLFYIVVLQIPGLVLAQVRAMKIPPMKALREE